MIEEIQQEDKKVKQQYIHESQTDAAKGFGGSYGVQQDRVDKSAVGWDYHTELNKHESQKGRLPFECIARESLAESNRWNFKFHWNGFKVWNLNTPAVLQRLSWTNHQQIDKLMDYKNFKIQRNYCINKILSFQTTLTGLEANTKFKRIELINQQWIGIIMRKLKNMNHRKVIGLCSLRIENLNSKWHLLLN